MTQCDCTPIDPSKILDVRTIPCSSKHSLILQRWCDLPVNDYFVLVNGHDPAPLRYQFEAEFPGAFRWEYLAPAADCVRIKITKSAAVVADRNAHWTCPSTEAH